ncbi:hypothetical protein QBC34DRAFT_475490 [Podospora aff. communis PSN243]|uniref:Rhodopsin domain-containing protein n=1 Tax=Podospora aff. communis PSN243 TaxID=3040156 RepID=A0AAV9GA76_9PEZI|nr:hypothetical protein QBC34DRAFT_475490 [Podospora aff. communis PSN243]
MPIAAMQAKMDDPAATNATSPPPIAYDVPILPISDRAAYLARVHYGVMAPLLALTLVTFSARLYVRTWPVWRVGWDDALVALGFLFSVATFALLCFEMFPSPRLITFAQATQAIMLAYIAIPVWVIAMTCIKISVALTLLKRFHPLTYTTRWWRPLMLFLIAVQLAYFAANMVYNFSKCRPLVAAWDMSTPDAACYTSRTDFIFSLTGSVINITTDVALSVSPLVAVLWRLRRPLPERILVCCLTLVGLLASGASIAKAVVVAQWTPELPPEELDSWAMAVSIATWTVAEQLIAVFGACSPALKGPIERGLARFGIELSPKMAPPDIGYIVDPTTVGRRSLQDGNGTGDGKTMYETEEMTSKASS